MSDQNPFGLSNIWTVFNPTPKKVCAMFDGVEIAIEPFSEFVTPIKKVHDHLLKDKNCQNRGLVSYTFTDEMKRIYKTDGEFRKAQALKGLEKLEEFLEMTLYYERTATQHNSTQKVPTFLKSRVSQMEKDLNDLKAFVAKFLEGGLDESATDKDTSEKKAGRVKSESVVK